MQALERPEATRVAELYGNLTAMVEALRAKRCSAWTIRRPLAGGVESEKVLVGLVGPIGCWIFLRDLKGSLSSQVVVFDLVWGFPP